MFGEQLRTLRHRGFASFWSATLVSSLGNRMHEIAFAWLIMIELERPFLFTACVVAGTIAEFCLSLPAGAIADRYNRKLVLFLSYVGNGLAVALIPLFGRGEYLAEVVVLTAFGAGITNAFFSASRSSLLPNLVPNSELDEANGMISLISNSISLLYIAGGIAVSVVGVYKVFWLDTLTFFLAALLVLIIPSTAGETDSTGTMSLWGKEGVLRIKSLINDGKVALKTVSESPSLKTLLIHSISITAITAPMVIVIPAFVENIIGGNSTDFGFVYTAYSVGTVSGTVLVSRIMDRITERGYIVVIGTSFTGVFLAGAALLPADFQFPVILTGLFFAIAGFAGMISSIPARTIYQLLIPDEERGRVQSVWRMTSLTLPSLSFLVVSLLLGAVTPDVILLFQGVLLVLVGLWVVLTPLTKSSEHIESFKSGS